MKFGEWLQQLLSEEGSASSMRLAFLCWMTIITFTFCFCVIWVVYHKKEFPEGIWSAIAGLGGTGGIGFAFKYMQKRVESSKVTPTPSSEGSEQPGD